MTSMASPQSTREAVRAITIELINMAVVSAAAALTVKRSTSPPAPAPAPSPKKRASPKISASSPRRVFGPFEVKPIVAKPPRQLPPTLVENQEAAKPTPSTSPTAPPKSPAGPVAHRVSSVEIMQGNPSPKGSPLLQRVRRQSAQMSEDLELQLSKIASAPSPTSPRTDELSHQMHQIHRPIVGDDVALAKPSPLRRASFTAADYEKRTLSGAGVPVVGVAMETGAAVGKSGIPRPAKRAIRTLSAGTNNSSGSDDTTTDEVKVSNQPFSRYGGAGGAPASSVDTNPAVAESAEEVSQRSAGTRAGAAPFTQPVAVVTPSAEPVVKTTKTHPEVSGLRSPQAGKSKFSPKAKPTAAVPSPATVNVPSPVSIAGCDGTPRKEGVVVKESSRTAPAMASPTAQKGKAMAADPKTASVIQSSSGIGKGGTPPARRGRTVVPAAQSSVPTGNHVARPPPPQVALSEPSVTTMDDDTALAIAAEIERESRVQEGQEEEKKGEEFVSEADRAAAAQELVARLRKEARERERAKKSVESEDRSKFLSDGAGIPGAACILDAVIVPDGKRLNKLKGESPAAGTVTQAKVRHAHGADIMTLTYPDAETPSLDEKKKKLAQIHGPFTGKSTQEASGGATAVSYKQQEEHLPPALGGPGAKPARSGKHQPRAAAAAK